MPGDLSQRFIERHRGTADNVQVCSIVASRQLQQVMSHTVWTMYHLHVPLPHIACREESQLPPASRLGGTVPESGCS